MRRREPEGRIRIMLSKDDILAALAAVPGPDGKTPLNRSGAIDGVTIRDGKVFVAIRVNPARGARDGADARRRRGADQGAFRRGLGAGDADRRERRRAGGSGGGRPHASAAARNAVDPRRRQDHRGRLRQGRRRQVDHRLQSRARPRRARPESRRARRRRVRPVDAAPARHRRQARPCARRPEAEADGEVRPQGDVDRLPGRRRARRWSGAGRW